MLVLKYLLFFLSLYIFFYNPIFQILGFGLIKPLLLISILYLFVRRLHFRFIKTFRVETAFTFFIIYYISLKSITGDLFGLTTAYMHLVWFLESFIISVFLVLFFREIFSKYSWESTVVFVGLVASLLTLYLILNPEINLIVRESVIIDPLDLHTISILSFRGFSIAEGSTYGYGIIQGLILSICLFNLRKSWLYGIPVILLFISVMFNARIGFSVVFAAMLIMVLYGRIRVLPLFLLLLIIISGYFLIIFLSESYQIGESLEWGLGFFKEIGNFLQGGDESDNISIILNEMMFLPQDAFGLLLGEGESVFSQYGKNSDVGYVNQIFAGGFLYLFVMLLFLIWLFYRNYRVAENRMIPVLFYISLIIVNIKGNALFISSGFSRMMIFYLVYSVIVKEGFSDDELSD